DFKDGENFVFCQADGKPIDPDSLRRLGIYPALEEGWNPFSKARVRLPRLPALRGFDDSQANRKFKTGATDLGHPTLSTTADIYTSVDEEQVAETAEALGKAFCDRSVVEPHCASNSVN